MTAEAKGRPERGQPPWGAADQAKPGSVGAPCHGRSEGPPRARPAPLGAANYAKRGSVGAPCHGRSEGPPEQGQPLGGSEPCTKCIGSVGHRDSKGRPERGQPPWGQRTARSEEAWGPRDLVKAKQRPTMPPQTAGEAGSYAVWHPALHTINSRHACGMCPCARSRKTFVHLRNRRSSCQLLLIHPL